MQPFFARWVPPSERSFLPAVSVSGMFLGTPLTLLASGWLLDWFHWPELFYVFGALGCVWFMLWTLLSSSGPENHRCISEAERKLIIDSLQSEKSKRQVMNL